MRGPPHPKTMKSPTKPRTGSHVGRVLALLRRRREWEVSDLMRRARLTEKQVRNAIDHLRLWRAQPIRNVGRCLFRLDGRRR